MVREGGTAQLIHFFRGRPGRGVAAVVGIIFLTGLLMVIVRPNQPRQDGKTLSSWLEELHKTPKHHDYCRRSFRLSAMPPANELRNKQAIEAIQEIGADALPFLLRRLSYTPLSDATKAVRSSFGVSGSKMAAEAIDGFIALGDRATPAVPELVSFLSRSAPVRLRAKKSLSAIGKNAVPILKKMIEKRRGDSRVRALSALATLHRDKESFHRDMVETVVNALESDHLKVRNRTARILDIFSAHADLVVPALIESVDDPSFPVRYNSLISLLNVGTMPMPREVVPALESRVANARPRLRAVIYAIFGDYGANAQSAIPLLETAVQTENEKIRAAAKKALRNIRSDLKSR